MINVRSMFLTQEETSNEHPDHPRPIRKHPENRASDQPLQVARRGPGYGNSSDKQTLVAWLEQGSNTAYVGSRSNRVDVAVVQGTPKCLRTHADGQWTNNLTSLPEF